MKKKKNTSQQYRTSERKDKKLQRLKWSNKMWREIFNQDDLYLAKLLIWRIPLPSDNFIKSLDLTKQYYVLPYLMRNNPEWLELLLTRGDLPIEYVKFIVELLANPLYPVTSQRRKRNLFNLFKV